MVYIYNEIILNHKKNEIMPFETTFMDLDGIMISISLCQKEKAMYCMLSLPCGI